MLELVFVRQHSFESNLFPSIVTCQVFFFLNPSLYLFIYLFIFTLFNVDLKLHLYTHLFTLLSKKHSKERLHSCAVSFLVFTVQIICIYVLQSLHKHRKDTYFLIFLLKILKYCNNLMSMGTRSHIFGPINEMGSVPCLTEFTLRLCNVSFR